MRPLHFSLVFQAASRDAEELSPTVRKKEENSTGRTTSLLHHRLRAIWNTVKYLAFTKYDECYRDRGINFLRSCWMYNVEFTVSLMVLWLCVGFVPTATESRLAPLPGLLPHSYLVDKEIQLPEAFTSTATHFRPIILTADGKVESQRLPAATEG